ncbi:MAG: tetratricopeptide repeat protein [Bryobacteraceae bacterium]
MISRAIAIWDSVRGPESMHAALARLDLAEVDMQRGNFAEVELYLRPALAVSEKILGPSHPQAAVFRKSLGALLVYRGRHDEAEPLLASAAGILRNADPRMPRELATLNVIGQLHISRGEFESAEPILQEALAVNEALGLDHPSTLISLGNLASLLVQLKKFNRAEPLLRRAVQIGEQKLGANHPMVARALGDLGAVYGDTGKVTLAESVLKRALNIAEDALPQVEQILLNQLARVYFQQRRFDEAIPMLHRMARIALHTPGAGLERATGSYYLARIHAAQGRIAQAELSFLEAIALLEKHSGPNNPQLLDVLREYAALIRRDRKAEVRVIENRIKSFSAAPVR